MEFPNTPKLVTFLQHFCDNCNDVSNIFLDRMTISTENKSRFSYYFIFLLFKMILNFFEFYLLLLEAIYFSDSEIAKYIRMKIPLTNIKELYIYIQLDYIVYTLSYYINLKLILLQICISFTLYYKLCVENNRNFT